jgi:predicted nucleic-acid-binding Zn-ribbon protein
MISKVITFTGLILLIISWAIYFMGLKQIKPQTTENVITVIACKNCDYREERPFMEGDYVFKEIGKCKKCSGTSYIYAIYLVPVKK